MELKPVKSRGRVSGSLEVPGMTIDSMGVNYFSSLEIMRPINSVADCLSFEHW